MPGCAHKVLPRSMTGAAMRQHAETHKALAAQPGAAVGFARAWPAKRDVGEIVVWPRRASAARASAGQ